jgi:SpoVK/Ycf46/Vps4 family AAA+-type ATPase
MFNKRNNHSLNPKRISEYNKLLCTLDKSLNENINDIYENIILKEKEKILKEKEKILKEKEKDDNKNELDEKIEHILEMINKNFIVNDHCSSFFSGNNISDNCCSDNNNPNYYKEINNNTNPYSTQNNIKESNFAKNIAIRETINIETEINNISDILFLVDRYQNDPAVKYNINMKALHDIKEPLEELNNMIGMKDLKNNIVDQILYFVQELHKNNCTTGDFMHTVIYGPPGTGKTEIAKIMGKIYSKLGVLSKGTFKKVTRSDLIAGYLGQTALKTREAIKESIGGVLFIDEAYALGSLEKKDSFAKECIDTLCEALSDNKENLMVIIAGYEKELKDCFFNFNQGLDSRFTWRFKTDEYTHEDLYNIFLKKVKEIGWEIDANSKINAEWFKKNKDYFKYYGRDIETILAKTKIAHSKRVFCKPENEKRKIILKDLDKGFEIYLNNEDVKNRKDDLEMKKYLFNTLYS